MSIWNKRRVQGQVPLTAVLHRNGKRIGRVTQRIGETGHRLEQRAGRVAAKRGARIVDIGR